MLFRAFRSVCPRHGPVKLVPEKADFQNHLVANHQSYHGQQKHLSKYNSASSVQTWKDLVLINF